MTLETILQKLKRQPREQKDVELILHAYQFAARAHEGQKRKSGEPYIVHPLATALRLIDMRLDAPTIAASLLHDVCEDGHHSREEIAKEFGEEIAFLVAGVTKLDKIRYHGTQRSAESLRKMFLAIGEDIRIVLLKLADRFHNMETLQYLPTEKQKRIALETLEIYAPLAYRLGIKELSGQLEDLAFPYVHQKEYEWLTKTTQERYLDWERYLKTLKPIIAEELKKEKIAFLDIHARAKHYYSLYKKLLKYDMDVTQVTDIMALRIIVASVEDCYTVLGAIHKLWPPLPGKIKDYIALPKPNGYQSLHTTVFGPEGRPVEIQMRTPEMHEEAEYGIAAHWAYAEQKRSKAKTYARGLPAVPEGKQFAWIQQIREWQKEFENPEEFLDSLKIDFFKHRIFVLTPKGDIIDLPEGATPIDFAYQIHSQIGDAAMGAKVGGKMVSLEYHLQSGDVVHILTQKNKTPSKGWLSFVKTGQARKRINSLLKKREESERFEKPGGETVEIRLTLKDRGGALRDVTGILARQKIHMRNVTTDNSHRSHPLLTFQATFKQRADLEKTIVKLKSIKGVEEISYKLHSP